MLGTMKIRHLELTPNFQMMCYVRESVRVHLSSQEKSSEQKEDPRQAVGKEILVYFTIGTNVFLGAAGKLGL